MIMAFGRAIVRIFFREIVIEGAERLPDRGPVIFTPNHPNALVDPLLLWLLPREFRIRFVAKAPLFKIPLLGWLLHSVRAIPVVRRLDVAGEIDYTQFFAACVEALAAGDSVAIFPEGRSLPQPFLAPLRTGPARLFFMARERGIRVQIVPIGLNFEQGGVFRSSALISVASPLKTEHLEAQYEDGRAGAVRGLIAEIAWWLDQHVFQAETYRDRELMLLLESLYAEEEQLESLPSRFARLNEFERGLARLRASCPEEIDRLRRLLARYQRVSETFDVDPSPRFEPSTHPVWLWMASLIGVAVAGVGWALNWGPYRLCGTLVRLTGRDEADAATFKIVYALFLFPLFYLLEGMLIAYLGGWSAAVAFAVVIFPLSYFTLRFFEWREELGDRGSPSARWFGGGVSRRVTESLEKLRSRIIGQVDALAARPELQNGDLG